MNFDFAKSFVANSLYRPRYVNVPGMPMDSKLPLCNHGLGGGNALVKSIHSPLKSRLRVLIRLQILFVEMLLHEGFVKHEGIDGN